ncbi:hypothetical protein JCM18899A_40640 [Nocardioides sp. AN3]
MAEAYATLIHAEGVYQATAAKAATQSPSNVASGLANLHKLEAERDDRIKQLGATSVLQDGDLRDTYDEMTAAATTWNRFQDSHYDALSDYRLSAHVCPDAFDVGDA